jgi:hypothetical protein
MGALSVLLIGSASWVMGARRRRFLGAFEAARLDLHQHRHVHRHLADLIPDADAGRGRRVD